MAGSSKRQISRTSVAYIALGVALITLTTIGGASAFLRTNDIKVEGISIHSAQDIIDASGLSLGNNLLFVNTQNASQKIRQELPLINVATVTRILPDTILIEVSESSAIAKISFAGGEHIIDSTGRVLASGEPGSRLQQHDEFGNEINLIEIRGLDIDTLEIGSVIRPVFGSEMKLQYLQDVLSAVEREGLENDVSYLDVSNIVNVHLGYLNIYRVILGGSTSLRPGNLRHNLGRLPESVIQIVARHPNTPGDIDMSDPNSNPLFRST